ncbi:hypothetical protein PG990_008746 [Apiospora arundinis]
MEDSFTLRPMKQDKRSLSLHDLADNPASALASGLSGLSISQDEARPRYGRNDLGREDLRILSRGALEDLVIDLCNADPVNTSLVRNVLHMAKLEVLKAEEAQRAAEDALARGHYSSWDTLNKGTVEIEHIRPIGQTHTQTSDVESIVFSDVEPSLPLRAGEAICKHCFKRYFRKDNGPQACKYHPGRPQYFRHITHPEESEGLPALGSSPNGLGTAAVAANRGVDKHRPLVAAEGPPGVVYSDDDTNDSEDPTPPEDPTSPADTSAKDTSSSEEDASSEEHQSEEEDSLQEEQPEEESDSSSSSDDPASISLESSRSDESFTLQG